MIYKLKISNKSIELVRLVTSSEEKKTNEIKIANTKLGFRFNRSLISSNEFFDEFVEKISTLLQPFLADISELKITLRSSFFNIHEIPLDNLSRLEFNTTYLNWEVNQFITNTPENYLYGFVHDTAKRKTIIIIIRDKIQFYFEKIFTSINGSIEQWSVGFDYQNEDQIVFVGAKRAITPIYPKEKQSLVERTGEKIKKFKITNVIKLLASVFVLFLIIISFFNRKVVTDNLLSVFSQDDVITTKSTDNVESQIDTLVVAATDSNKVNLEKRNTGIEGNDELVYGNSEIEDGKSLNNLYYNFIYYVMIDKSDVNFLIIDNNSALLKFNFSKETYEYKKEFENNLKQYSKDLKVLGSKRDILKFSLINYNIDYNANLIAQSIENYDIVKENLGIKTKNETISFDSKSSLLAFIKSIFMSDLYFKNLKISVRNDKFYLVVDFV